MMARLSVVIAISTALLGGAARAEDFKNVPAGSRSQQGQPPVQQNTAGPPQPDSVAKAGVETRVGSAWDCDMKSIAPTIWVHAEHGIVIIRNIIGPACGEQTVRQAGMFYKSDPGFKGEDKLWITGFLTKSRLDATLRVQVH